MAVKKGCKAPAFKVATTDGGEVGREDLEGKITVLFFYPKDSTSGCTKEAQAFRDASSKFRCRGTRVLGVSRDSLKSHAGFQAKHELNFPLLSDGDKTMHEAFGVMKEKTQYGRKFMGVERSTFLLDGKGKVREIWRNVKVPGHVEEVLEAVSDLRKKLKG